MTMGGCICMCGHLIMAFATLAPPITGGWNQAYSHDISSSKLTVEWVLIGQ